MEYVRERGMWRPARDAVVAQIFPSSLPFCPSCVQGIFLATTLSILLYSVLVALACQGHTRRSSRQWTNLLANAHFSKDSRISSSANKGEPAECLIFLLSAPIVLITVASAVRPAVSWVPHGGDRSLLCMIQITEYSETRQSRVDEASFEGRTSQVPLCGQPSLSWKSELLAASLQWALC